MSDEVKIIADDRVAKAQTDIASSGSRNADTFKRNADAMARLSTLDLVPRADHDVWLQVFVRRAALANSTNSKVENAAKYADAALAEYRERFPRAAEPVMPVSTVPSVG